MRGRWHVCYSSGLSIIIIVEELNINAYILDSYRSPSWKFRVFVQSGGTKSKSPSLTARQTSVYTFRIVQLYGSKNERQKCNR